MQTTQAMKHIMLPACKLLGEGARLVCAVSM